MTQFKSPEEAINACNEGCEREWETFSKSVKLDETKDPTTYNATKSIFRMGYMAGAKWVSSTIVQRMMSSATKLPDTTSKS